LITSHAAEGCWHAGIILHSEYDVILIKNGRTVLSSGQSEAYPTQLDKLVLLTNLQSTSDTVHARW